MDTPERHQVPRFLRGLCACGTNSCLIQWPSEKKSVQSVTDTEAQGATDIQAGNIEVFLELSKIRTTGSLSVSTHKVRAMDLLTLKARYRN